MQHQAHTIAGIARNANKIYSTYMPEPDRIVVMRDEMDQEDAEQQNGESDTEFYACMAFVIMALGILLLLVSFSNDKANCVMAQEHEQAACWEDFNYRWGIK